MERGRFNWHETRGSVPDFRIKTDVSDEINLKDIVNGKILLKSKKNVKTQIEGTLTPIKDENGNNDSIIIIFRNM